MDTLSVSAALLSVLALAQRSAKLISADSRLRDPKVDQIYHRLLAEKKRTEGWASHMRVLNSTDLRPIISHEEYDKVIAFLEKLDTYYRQAHERFSTSERSKDGPMNLPFLKARTKSLLGGYEDLKEFVDTLAAINKALRSIAPPLPTCSPEVCRDGSPIRVSSPVPVDDDVSLAAEPSPVPGEITQNVDEANSVDEPTTTQSIHSIYQATLDSLVVLSVRRRNPEIAQSASRLKLWGAGLFEMSVPLDVILDSDKDGCVLLRRCILEFLVEILVWEEQELNILASEAGSCERFHDQHRAHATTALLGSDELTSLAIESWRNLLARQTDNETGPTGSRTGGDLVPDLIQILFDLLPALRAAKQTYCMRLAETSVYTETITPGQAGVSTAPSSVKTSSDNIDRKLDVAFFVKTFNRNRDSILS